MALLADAFISLRVCTLDVLNIVRRQMVLVM